MQGQISNSGLTVDHAMLSNGTIDFHGIGGTVHVGSFLGALTQLNFHNTISSSVQLGGITAGQINITNNYAPPNININLNSPGDV